MSDDYPQFNNQTPINSSMHEEKYSLKWQTYSDHLKSMMKELMMNEDFSDVTLITEDNKHIKANITILSACRVKDVLPYYH